MLWLTGGGLAVSLLMILGLLGLVVWQGIITFWPAEVVRVETPEGPLMGEVSRAELYEPGRAPSAPEDTPPPSGSEAGAAPPVSSDQTEGATDPAGANQSADNASAESAKTITADEEQTTTKLLGLELARRRLIRTGNFDLTGTHFHWVTDSAIDREDRPEWAIVVERTEWGRFYGFPRAFIRDGQAVADAEGLEGEALAEARGEVWRLFNDHHAANRSRYQRIKAIEDHDIGRLNHEMESARLHARGVALDHGPESPEAREARERFEQTRERVNARFQELRQRIAELRERNERFQIVFETAEGQSKRMQLADVVRAYPANQLSRLDRVEIYLSRWWEFLTAAPREANTEGGVMPAIIGTVTMTLLMSVAVVPFGVLAALYLREYARAGPLVSAVRIAVNNLAGVPSIVFGVFGLGFFCYIVGGYIDGGPERIGYEPMSAGAWTVGLSAWLGALAAGLAVWQFVLKRLERASAALRGIRWLMALVWLIAMILLAGYLLTHTPFFNGLFRAKLPSPTFGTGGVMWASFTLALLTLPVVIVATEEALAAVPGSMREGSYACGASKWQTIRRIVLPRAMPGIMTGTILAMARGAGEVAPLMLVGVVKLAPELPVDGLPPYVHLERSFMHLGFHIYDLGFQSQNSEAAKPMVYTTTLLLIAIIATLNLSAIWLRSRLKRKFVATAF